MKQGRITAAAIALLLLTACAENPDSDIIVHKDMEKLISAAQQTDNSKADIADLQQHDRYTAEFGNDSLRVTVHANAEVEVPEIDRLSMYRVQQRRFTQEDCDRVRAYFMGDAPVCDLTETRDSVPRARIAHSVELAREDIAQERARFDSDPEYAAQFLKALQDNGEANSLEEYLAQMQAEIDRDQEHYESAPVTIDYSAYPSEGKLERNADRIAAEKDQDGFWHQYCQDITDGDTLWVCTEDAKAMLHVQNSDDFSNVIWFSHSPVGFTDLGSYIIELRELSELRAEGGLDTIEGETCTLSQADAEQKAEDALQALGVADFVCCESAALSYPDSVNVLNETDGAEDFHTYARPCWILRYCRAIDGVPIAQPSGTKQSEHTGKDNYIEKLWPPEMIEFRINDSGIIQFQWNAPLEITETVAENTAMKPFDEIKANAETMLPMIAANEIPELSTEIQIDRVTLSYSRISEKDDFGKGLIVPVWGFYGSKKVTGEDYYDEHLSFDGVQLALNAIDGSVIDAELGY